MSLKEIYNGKLRDMSPADEAKLRARWAEWNAGAADRAKATKTQRVGAELAKRNADGFVYQGVAYQIDEASQARITALAVLAQADGGKDWPADFRFIAADNSGVPFTASEFVTFAAAAAKAVIARRLNARSLKDAVRAAQDVDAVKAVDITAGWDSGK